MIALHIVSTIKLPPVRKKILSQNQALYIKPPQPDIILLQLGDRDLVPQDLDLWL